MSPQEEFEALYNEIFEYQKHLSEQTLEKYNIASLEAEKEEIQLLWSELKTIYKVCVSESDLKKDKKLSLQKKKRDIHDIYIRYIGILGDFKDKKESTDKPEDLGSSIKVPPCETETFYGDYVGWPSFRDLFTSIYINNRKLSSVEKLYHLFQKTGGEAREINRNIPLTENGFGIAWQNLKDHYENKRLLINNQLRVLFNLPHCTQESSSCLKKLQRDITNCMSILELYAIDIGSWDPIFVYQCSSKLPKLTLSLWEQSVAGKSDIPKWKELDKFLTDRFHAIESVSDMIGSNQANNSHYQRQRNANNVNYDRTKQYKVHHIKVKYKCVHCKEGHKFYRCPKLEGAEVLHRISMVRKYKHCMNCLDSGHMSANCTSKISCSKCGGRHHSLLHNARWDKNNNGPQLGDSSAIASTSQQTNIQSTSNDRNSSGDVRAYHTAVSNKTMLATAWISIMKSGRSYKVRALVDPCSDDTFVSNRLQSLLNLPTKPITADISGLGGELITKCTKIAAFTIGSLIDPHFSIDIDALVVSEVTGNVPTHSLDKTILTHLPQLKFADPKFYESSPVDILIGGNLYPIILRRGVEHNILGSLVAQETAFGWILTGPTNDLTSRRLVRVSHCTRVCLNEQLSKFWEIEEVPKQSHISEEDRICEKIYRETTVRTASGRYMVDLPFKSQFPLTNVGPNRYMALSQYLRNEKSLSRKPELNTHYDDVIKEYLSLGHMDKIDVPKGNFDGCFYLPHHGVFKPESTTTQLRVVFNASCKSARGNSLNDALYVGPVLQKDIVSLILNWRIYKYVFNADISKMYRQILINPKHAPYQRILFRPSLNEEVQDFQLKTVTFGVNCAPYLALRTLLQLAEDEKHRFPIGSKILCENMYVDDALVGIHSISEGLESRDQLKQILLAAGFHLRKWTSNHQALLNGLPPEHLLNEDFLTFDENTTAKTLGIRWNAVSDSFYFKTEKIQNKESFTKREVLSVIAKLFDPLGWLAPVIITAKIFLQQLWLDTIEWDEPLSKEILIRWQEFVSNYSQIDTISIPRWVNYSPHCKVELHGFCDSSELAYAASIYIRVEIGNTVHIHLLVSKSKVAPIKKLSLPRLELCGALLLANLVDSLLPQFKLPKTTLMSWSDSTIVLAWLKKPSYHWTTFVANRVSIIQEKIGTNWRHVSTSDNPADLATRGLTPFELKENTLWWNGPNWLNKDPQTWPSNIAVAETSLEAKPIKVHIARSSEDDILNRFSCLDRAIRVISYMFRFFHQTKTPTKRTTTYDSRRLSAFELGFVRTRLMALSQSNHFWKEVTCLKRGINLPSDSPLLSLSPILDENQLIRANGRLADDTSLSANERYPIILAYQSRLSQLYVASIHQKTMHGGIQLTLATIRTECWIIRGKSLVKTHIHKCRECVLSRNKRQGQMMSTLPKERTNFSRPFTICGVDFAGPIEIKNFAGRGCRISKGYICLFVCFSTKAIHLEAVSDLSTPAFLAALSRFVSRRGCPQKIYSDNGKNFVGAAKELKTQLMKVIGTLKDEAIAKYGFQKLEWSFIPAAAPHMGGLWEAGVKSCKTHLKKMAGQMRYSFEEFSTILSNIEACLNSRPLVPLNDNIDDISALTPGHFLIGSAILSPAEPEEIPSKSALLHRWRKLKLFQQEFCRRWKTEYLKELNKRTKWKLPQPDLQLNDIVVLKNDGICSTDWRLGRIVKIYRGRDNLVRVADLKTQSGTITRPVHKLVLLPKTQ